MEALRRAADASGVVRAAFSERPAALRDPVRLVLDGAPGGVSGEALGAYLRARGCEPEHTDSRYAILIPTPFNTEEEFARLERALRELPAARLSVGAAAGFTPFLADERPEAGAVPPGCPPPSRRNRAGRGGGRPDRRAQRVSLPARNRRRCPGGTAVAGSGADAGNRRIFPDCCIKNLVTAHKIQYNIKAATCRATRSLNETEDLFYETDLRHCE